MTYESIIIQIYCLENNPTAPSYLVGEGGGEGKHAVSTPHFNPLL